MKISPHCAPGQVCPAYRAGKYPEMCACLKKAESELRRALWVGCVIIVATIALLSYSLYLLIGLH
jgi:hypothetical protein